MVVNLSKRRRDKVIEARKKKRARKRGQVYSGGKTYTVEKVESTASRRQRIQQQDIKAQQLKVQQQQSLQQTDSTGMQRLKAASAPPQRVEQVLGKPIQGSQDYQRRRVLVSQANRKIKEAGIKGGAKLTQEEYDALQTQKKQDERDYYTGSKPSLRYGLTYVGRKVYPPIGGKIDASVAKSRMFTSQNYPTSAGVEANIKPSFQSKVDTGEYQVDTKGYLTGAGALAWDAAYQTEFERQRTVFLTKQRKEGISEDQTITSTSISGIDFKDGLKFNRETTSYEAPVSPRLAYDAASSAALFGAFSPAFSTGAYRTEQSQIIRTGKDAGKIKGMTNKEYTEALRKGLKGDYVDASGKYVAPKTSGETAAWLKSSLGKIKTSEGKAAFIKASYKELGAKEFGKVSSYFGQSSSVATATKTAVGTKVKLDIYDPTVQMDYIGATGAVAIPKYASKFDIVNTQFDSQFSEVKLDTATGIASLADIETGVYTKSKSKNKQKTAFTQAQVPTQVVAPAQAFSQTPALLTGGAVAGAFSQDSGSKSRGRGQFSKGLLGGFLAFKLGADFGSVRTRRVPAQSKFGYTPSFKALKFGIKGKKPTQTKFRGYETRPITADWAASLGFKKKKKKKGVF